MQQLFIAGFVPGFMLGAHEKSKPPPWPAGAEL